ncbi:hypothetical protein PsorP6_014625 [Peronosclerospora sorghi]|uniref:Uncharacterized protein n=1 Tax=Peronosclerospora sorghi TaxID=230839 RepID=A0ACC0VT23_9STRA|nr:hypothetical protein PsorP6_014625 [Peronosclerospora sorghi]
MTFLSLGFSNVCFAKSVEVFFIHPHDGSHSTAKELFLNYGIFLFALIGAVSIWMLMYSWVSFLNIIIGIWIATLSQDPRSTTHVSAAYPGVLHHGIFLFYIVVLMKLIYDLMELPDREQLSFYSLAPKVTSKEVVQPSMCPSGYKTALLMTSSEQVENSRAMISQAICGVEDNYNDTMWWPPLKSLVKTYYVDAKSSDGNATSHLSVFSKLRLPENMTLVQSLTFAYSKVESVNMTSMQLTDWTSKGL